jgi:DNA modification methylase
LSAPAWKKTVGNWESEQRNGSVFERGNRVSHQKGDIRQREGRMPRSVLRFANGNFNAFHPTQKPLALLEYLVRTYTDKGDTVLDFTMGSGTTGHACMNLGRRFIGIEQDAAYFAIAQERIADAADPLRHMTAQEVPL